MPSPSLQPILALLGYPLAGNPTQYMMEKAFEYHQLDWRYLTLEVAPEDLGDAIRGLRGMGFSGANCADPHKEPVLEHLDQLGRTAELAGAVNCVLRRQGQLVGENTEGLAVVEAIRRRRDPAGKRVALLGAGRIGRAIAVELAQAGVAEIAIANRSEGPAHYLADLIPSLSHTGVSLLHPVEDHLDLPDQVDLVINATSVGQEEGPAALPFHLTGLSHHALLVDVTADPARTPLIRHGEDIGCETIDGLEVFVGQAVINLKLWTGVDANPTVLYEAVEEFLAV